jgi:hypothetical protein
MERTYSEREYLKFEKRFFKAYPKVYLALTENCICISPVIFALYESSIFDQVMKK